MSDLYLILPDPPAGWQLTHLMLLDPEWQVNIKDKEHVAIGTGETPDAAMVQAIDNALNERFAGRLFTLSRREPSLPSRISLGLLSALGLGGEPIKRRRIT